jgi:hypothetical protein
MAGLRLSSPAFGPTSTVSPPTVRPRGSGVASTMNLASALERLSNYSTKNTRASRQIFESGVVIFRNNALHKLGDDSERRLPSLYNHSLRPQPS